MSTKAVTSIVAGERSITNNIKSFSVTTTEVATPGDLRLMKDGLECRVKDLELEVEEMKKLVKKMAADNVRLVERMEKMMAEFAESVRTAVARELKK